MERDNYTTKLHIQNMQIFSNVSVDVPLTEQSWGYYVILALHLYPLLHLVWFFWQTSQSMRNGSHWPGHQHFYSGERH